MINIFKEVKEIFPKLNSITFKQTAQGGQIERISESIERLNKEVFGIVNRYTCLLDAPGIKDKLSELTQEIRELRKNQKLILSHLGVMPIDRPAERVLEKIPQEDETSESS